MSDENLQLVRKLYEWMAAGDAEKAFELYDPEIEWDSSNAPWLLALGFEPIVRGHEPVRRGIRAWFEAWEEIDYGAPELIDSGDEVLAFVRVRARGRASGVSVSYETSQLWTLRDGKIVRMRLFGDRGEALRALSQSE
jgi:ketosteroid isomerase-like protein